MFLLMFTKSDCAALHNFFKQKTCAVHTARIYETNKAK